MAISDGAALDTSTVVLAQFLVLLLGLLQLFLLPYVLLHQELALSSAAAFFHSGSVVLASAAAFPRFAFAALASAATIVTTVVATARPMIHLDQARGAGLHSA